MLTSDGFFDGLVTLSELVYNACTVATQLGKTLPEMEVSEVERLLLPFPVSWQEAAEGGLAGVLQQLVNRMLVVTIGRTT